MQLNALLDRTLDPFPPAAIPFDLGRINESITQQLAPLVPAIDQEGVYPREFMHRLGTLGGFGQTLTPAFGGQGQGFRSAVQVIEAVSQTCLCTGFMTWCHIACVWYAQNTDNAAIKTQVLPRIATGEVLAGTGLSNPMKHFADIEKIALVAERRSGGYVIDGLLPWVSNLGPGHYFAVVAKIADSEDYLMAIVLDRLPGLTLKSTAHFIALEGSNTYSCQLRQVFVTDDWILAAPCADYIDRIKPGFVLAQVGMGLGLTQACVNSMKRSNQRYGHVNGYLEDSVERIEADLNTLRGQTYALADSLNALPPYREPGFFRRVVQARADASELSLRASQSAMLYAGARSYLQGGENERRLREAYFVAMVTPALKHLKKVLQTLSAAP